MATLASRHALALDPTFYKRVIQACVKSAVDVVNEDPITPNHANRTAYADLVLRDPERQGQSAAFVVVGNDVVADAGTAATDNDIIFTVNTFWDQLSGK